MNLREHVMDWFAEHPRRWWSRMACRGFDRHDVYCRGRLDHTVDQRARTR